MTNWNRIPAVIGIWVLLFTSNLEPRGRVKDYIFSVTGVVLAADGTTLQGAEVILDVNGPVYEGVTLVKTVRHTTNSAGGFAFMYTSHKRGVKYTITVRKEGFEPQLISGSAPPNGKHNIRLERAKEATPSMSGGT